MRLEHIKNKYFDDVKKTLREKQNIKRITFNDISKYDPTKNKIYLQWIMIRIIKDNLLKEDLSRLSKYLEVYDKHKRKLTANNRNLYNIKSLSELYDIVKVYFKEKTKTEKRSEIDNETYVLYEKLGWKILIPLTQKSSCFWGLNTAWCTASSRTNNYFNHYNNENSLVIIITDKGEKFQYFLKRSGKSIIMNSSDRTVDNSSYIYDFFRENLDYINENCHINLYYLFNLHRCYLTDNNRCYFTNNKPVIKIDINYFLAEKRLIKIPLDFIDSEIKTILEKRNDLYRKILLENSSIDYLFDLKTTEYEKEYDNLKNLFAIIMKNENCPTSYKNFEEYDFSEEHISELIKITAKLINVNFGLKFYSVNEIILNKFNISNEKTKEMLHRMLMKELLKYNTEYFKMSLYRDYEMCLCAVSAGHTLKYIPNEHRKQELLKIAVRNDYYNYSYLGVKFQTKKLNEALAIENYKILKYINKNKYTEKMIEIYEEHKEELDNFRPKEPEEKINPYYNSRKAARRRY